MNPCLAFVSLTVLAGAVGAEYPIEDTTDTGETFAIADVRPDVANQWRVTIQVDGEANRFYGATATGWGAKPRHQVNDIRGRHYIRTGGDNLLELNGQTNRYENWLFLRITLLARTIEPRGTFKRVAQRTVFVWRR